MIIWGSRGVNSRVETGTFDCPRCGSNKPFELISVKRFFTLYFIPIFPMGGEAGRYLECKNCAGTFDEAVRGNSPVFEQAPPRASFQNVLLQAMLIMAEADGAMDDSEARTIAEIMTQTLKRPFGVTEVRAALHESRSQSLESVLSSVAETLSTDGKRTIIKCLLKIASGDGEVAEKEAAMLYGAGNLLGVRRRDIQVALSSPQS